MHPLSSLPILFYPSPRVYLQYFSPSTDLYIGKPGEYFSPRAWIIDFSKSAGTAPG
jgi:hypothetical protein